MNIIFIADIENGRDQEVKEFINQNVEPTYTDNDPDLGEDLYSITCLDDLNFESPEFVSEFVERIRMTSPDVGYFRFVN